MTTVTGRMDGGDRRVSRRSGPSDGAPRRHRSILCCCCAAEEELHPPRQSVQVQPNRVEEEDGDSPVKSADATAPPPTESSVTVNQTTNITIYNNCQVGGMPQQGPGARSRTDPSAAYALPNGRRLTGRYDESEDIDIEPKGTVAQLGVICEDANPEVRRKNATNPEALRMMGFDGSAIINKRKGKGTMIVSTGGPAPKSQPMPGRSATAGQPPRPAGAGGSAPSTVNPPLGLSEFRPRPPSGRPGALGPGVTPERARSAPPVGEGGGPL